MTSGCCFPPPSTGAVDVSTLESNATWYVRREELDCVDNECVALFIKIRVDAVDREQVESKRIYRTLACCPGYYTKVCSSEWIPTETLPVHLACSCTLSVQFSINNLIIHTHTNTHTRWQLIASR